MIKFALAALAALVVFAPAARAADEVKPPRQADQAAPTCRTTAPPVVDPKAPPAPRVPKAELEALEKLPLCAIEEPREACPPYAKLQMAAEEARMLSRSGSSNWPDWLMEFHRPDCGLDLLGDGRERGTNGFGGRPFGA